MTNNAIKTPTQNFIFRVPSRVYCPGCAAAITQRTFLIRHNIVWCLRCGEHPLDHADWLGIASEWTHLSHQWTTARGLRCWTPDDPLDGIVTHYLKSREESRDTIQHDDYYSNLDPPEDLIV